MALFGPAEERDRSPFTGWTRSHWEHAADRLLDGVRPYASPRQALVRLPGRPSRQGTHDDALEGFARTFLLAAFRLAGGGSPPASDLLDRYASGLAAGTDRAGAEAWPAIGDRTQSIVEAASIALALAETRDLLWERLDDPVRERLAAWLGRVRCRACHPTNWLLFPLVVHTFLRAVGAPHDPGEIERAFEAVDRLHRGGGWFSDGAADRFDHYAGWAFGLYPALWCRMGGDRADRARAELVRGRLRAFLEDYRHLFGANGSPVHLGRSLTYRFAAVAPFFAGALVGATPLAPGETRRLASGALRYFLDRGAVGEDGVLTLGWHGLFEAGVQAYSGPASPYWASKAFVGLLLPPGDPVWTAVEEPLPVERSDFVRPLPAPGLLAVGTRADGIVRVCSHRNAAAPLVERGTAPLYRKLAYSTHTAPELSRIDADAQTSLLVAGRGHPRSGARLRWLGATAAASSYSPALAPVRARVPRLLPPAGRRAVHAALALLSAAGRTRVETASLVFGAVEVRVHLVSTRRACRIRDGGFAVAAAEVPEADAGTGGALARTATLTSVALALHGFSGSEVLRAAGTNAYGGLSAAPAVHGEHPGGQAVYVSLLLLAGGEVDPEAVRSGLRVEARGRLVLLHARDGESALVQLGRPGRVDLELAGHRITGRVRYARATPSRVVEVLRTGARGR